VGGRDLALLLFYFFAQGKREKRGKGQGGRPPFSQISSPSLPHLGGEKGRGFTENEKKVEPYFSSISSIFFLRKKEGNVVREKKGKGGQ